MKLIDPRSYWRSYYVDKHGNEWFLYRTIGGDGDCMVRGQRKTIPVPPDEPGRMRTPVEPERIIFRPHDDDIIMDYGDE